MTSEAALKAWQTRWRKDNSKSVDYPPTQKEKNRVRALKAWKTIRSRGKFSNHIKNYDVKNKNKFRDKVIKSFNEIASYEWSDFDGEDRMYGNYCLTLESPDFLFVKSFKKRFIIVEHNHKQYKKMCENLPKQVSQIYFNDLSIVRQLPFNYSCDFLDFCRTFDSLRKLIVWIKPKLVNCKKIAFTFSLRGNKKEMEDYKFDIISKLQKVFPDYDLEYGNAYRDGSPMIGIILKTRNSSEKPSEYSIIKNEVVDWCRVACKNKFKHELYEWGDPIINPRASVNRITNFEKCKWLFNNLPLKYKKAIRLWSQNYRYDDDCVRFSLWHHKTKHRGQLFDFFVDVLS